MADTPLTPPSTLLRAERQARTQFDFRKKHDVIFEKNKLNINVSRPYKNVECYQESKNLVKLIKMIPETPELEARLESNPICNLMELKGELYKTEKKLKAKRERLEKVRIHTANEWAQLEKLEIEFRNQFITFNKFVTENHDKRIRMNKRLEDDRRVYKDRQKEIDKFLKEINEMLSTRADMESNIKKHEEQQAFLENVVEYSPEFTTISEIIERYDNLANARKLLAVRQKRMLDVLENAKNDMMKLIEEKNFIIMGLNNQIANLQARYENANIKALESEELVTQIKNNAVKQLNQIDTVKNSIWNVYVHMATSKKHPIKIKKDNVEEQMMYVNRTLTELNKVNKLIKKRAAKLNLSKQ